MAAGFCYLNNAALAAETLTRAGKRTAILDIDVHHGNGTEAIFYDRADVLTVSIHADPARFYPFFWGHAAETGRGEGDGFNLNLPLPRGTVIDDYRAALGTALERIAQFRAGRARAGRRARHRASTIRSRVLPSMTPDFTRDRPRHSRAELPDADRAGGRLSLAEPRRQSRLAARRPGGHEHRSAAMRTGEAEASPTWCTRLPATSARMSSAEARRRRRCATMRAISSTSSWRRRTAACSAPASG